jgi:ribosomal protein L21E
MKRMRLAALLFFFAVPALTWGQGSGSHPEPSRPTADPSGAGSAPFEVSRSVTGKILEIQLESHVLVVEDKDSKRVAFKLDGKTEFKADKKTELDGRKSLKLEDFESGQMVKVTFRPSDNKVLEVRLRHVKS